MIFCTYSGNLFQPEQRAHKIPAKGSRGFIKICSARESILRCGTLSLRIEVKNNNPKQTKSPKWHSIALAS